MITVLGLGAAGWDALPESSKVLIRNASVLLGGTRQLELIPPISGQIRQSWPAPLRANLMSFIAPLQGRSVVALASGDPLVSGIGSTLIELLGPDRVRVIPAVSSVALARAELGWSAESCVVVSVVGRDAASVLRELAPGRRVIVLSADEASPAEIATLLTREGYGDSTMTVLGDLGAESFSRIDAVAKSWVAAAPRLNIVALQLVGPVLHGWVAGLPDDAYEHDGQLTKRDVRSSALARLLPVPADHLWDVGAGAGSIGIEWMRAHPSCTATAIEARLDRTERITRNARRLGVPTLRVVNGSAPEALSGLDTPDAIFVGGGAGDPGVIEHCFDALPVGGRLVVHGVTLETETRLADLYAAHGGELTRLQIESVAPLGGYWGWKPARAVTQWAVTRH